MTQNTIAHHQPNPSPDHSKPLPANSPWFMYWAWFSMVWNNPLAHSDQLSGPCSLPTSYPAPHWQSMGNQKVLDFANLKHHCVTNFILILHSKCSTIPFSKKKLSLSQAKLEHRPSCKKRHSKGFPYSRKKTTYFCIINLQSS